MTIAKHEDRSATPAPYSTGATLIREAAAVMADALVLAKAVANTQMVPKHFYGKPEECAAAMLYGASLDLDPMQSLKSIYVVHGQAALYARAMVALALRGGHEVWTVESTDESVTVAGRRRGSPHVEQATWDHARAKKAGYTSNAKYGTDPQAMLYAKAASEVCRKIAPDVLSGVYSVEELRMERWDADVVDVQRSKPTGLAAALAKPAQADDTASVEPDAPTPLNTSGALARRMFALFGEAGITERDARLAYVSDVVQRPVESSADMTEDDARAVIVALEADLDQPLPDGAA